MHINQFTKYSEAGLIAELWTQNGKGRVLTRATLSVSAKEVMACVPGSNGRGPAHGALEYAAQVALPNPLPRFLTLFSIVSSIQKPTPSLTRGRSQPDISRPYVDTEWLHLFEMLLREGEGPGGLRLLQPATVRFFTTRFRVGMYDVVQGMQCDWTLGLFVGTSITGPHASSETFGHGGSQSSLGFCDPARKLTAVIACNTRPGPKLHYERMLGIATAIYEDMKLDVHNGGRRENNDQGDGKSAAVSNSATNSCQDRHSHRPHRPEYTQPRSQGAEVGGALSVWS